MLILPGTSWYLCRWRLVALCLAALLSAPLPALAQSAGLSSTEAPVGPHRAGQELSLQLSEQGTIALVLPCPSSHQVLRLHIGGAGAIGVVSLERVQGAAGRQPPTWLTGPFRDGVIRLPLAGAATVPAADTRCRLVLRGQPAAEVTLAPIGWHPVTLLTRLRGAWDDWTAFRPWGLASINFHTAVVQTWHGLSPNVLIGVLFVLVGLAGYWRWRSRFLLWWMLACWLALDLPWQWRLLEQVEATRDRFAGVAAEARPGVGEDAALWAFAERARSLLPAESRILVASASDYRGMRMAYYLYPLNVYWRRGGPELPGSSGVRAGEYIVVVQPTQVRGEPEAGQLVLGSQRWNVRPLLEADGIVMFEVR